LHKDLAIGLSVIMLLTTSAIVYIQSVEEFSVRRYSYVYEVYEWVLQINTTTVIPWIIGSIASVNISIYPVECKADSVLSITNLAISTGNISISRYIGIFNCSNEQRTTTITLPVVEPSLTSIKSGESRNIFVDIHLNGYIENSVDGARKNFSRSFSFPVVVSSPPSVLGLSIDSPKTVEADTRFFQVVVTAINMGSTPLFNTYLAIYINGSLYRALYLRSIDPNNITKTVIPIAIDRPGIYIVSATANYTTPLGVTGYSLANAITVVKSRPSIYITSNTSTAKVFKPIEISGMVSTPIRSAISIEISQNGIEWQELSRIYVDGNSFRYIWTPNSSGTYMLRAFLHPTDLYSSSTSNILHISVEKITPKIQLSGNIASGSQIKLSIQVDPKIQIDVDIMYRTSRDYSWRKYISVKTDSSGKGETIFTALQPDIYEFKAVINENNIFTYTESNTISIDMSQRTTTATQNITTQQQSQTPGISLNQYTIVIVIVLSSMVAALLLLIGRKR